MGAILFVAALAGSAPEQCRRIHYTADGRVIETRVSIEEGGVSASSRASGSGSSSSSVSVSSSSSASGDGSSVATISSTVDGVRRSTTVRRDANGCTITVDDRPSKE